MILNVKIELDEQWIDEYYGNLTKEFSEMLAEQIKFTLKQVVKEEVQADKPLIVQEVRRVIGEMNLRWHPTEIADLAHEAIEAIIKGKK